mgnify:CR=1 FL=1
MNWRNDKCVPTDDEKFFFKLGFWLGVGIMSIVELILVVVYGILT